MQIGQPYRSFHVQASPTVLSKRGDQNRDKYESSETSTIFSLHRIDGPRTLNH